MKRKPYHILGIRLVIFVYILLLIRLIIFKYPWEQTILGQGIWQWELVIDRWETANLMPFQTIKLYLRHRSWLGMISVENLIYNVIAFVPYGVLVHIIRGKTGFWFTCITGICLSAAIEVAQLITLLGVFDVDDIILNGFGVFLGIILYMLGRFICYFHSRQ